MKRLIILLGLCALSRPVAAQNNAPATAEDCAVLASVGEDRMQWQEKNPGQPMYARSFGIDCDWKALGIQPFEIPPLGPGPYYDGTRFSFSRPVYAPDGQSATVTFAVTGNQSARSYFAAEYECKVQRSGNIWQSTGCKMRAIT